MNRGYIKVWRKTIDSGWLQNHKLCAFWLWCLLKASHKEYDLIVGCQKVHLMPGDFVFGLNKASEELAMSIRSIRTILAFLKTSQNLTIKTTNKFSVISVVNWDLYQQTETTNDNQNDKPPTSYRQATDNKQTHKHKNTKEFIIPSIEDVQLYCHERNNTISPEVFIAHYKSNGWMVGKNKMKDWKSAIITWEERERKQNGSNRPSGSKQAIIAKTGNAQSDGTPWPADREY